MAFCVQCGQSVGERDVFCGACGARQPGASAGAAPPPPPPSSGGAPAVPITSGMSATTASLLCYTPWLGWIMSLVVLASESYRRNVDARFHAFQGLFLFITYQIIDKVLSHSGLFDWFPFPSWGLLKLLILGSGIWLMVTTSRGEKIKLPLLGDLAEKAASEQL